MSEGSGRFLLLGALAFCSELLLVAGAVWLGVRLLDGLLGVLLGALLAATIVLLWARHLAPRAPRRFTVGGRVAFACTLFLLVGTALAITGTAFGPGLTLAGCLVTVIAQPASAQWPVPSTRDS